MNILNTFTNEIVLLHLNEEIKLKLTNIYYLDEFCDQIVQNRNDIKKLVDETLDYLKEANICLTKKEASTFLTKIIEDITNDLAKKESEEEDDDEEDKNDEDEDLSELNDLEGGGEGKEVDGTCEMCFSSRRLTLHHAIPKLMIKRFKNIYFLLNLLINRLKRKKKKAPVIYLKLCSQCHSYILFFF